MFKTLTTTQFIKTKNKYVAPHMVIEACPFHFHDWDDNLIDIN